MPLNNEPVFHGTPVNGASSPTDASHFQNGASVILTGMTSGLEPVRKSHFLVEVMGPSGQKPPADFQYHVKSFPIPERAVEVKEAKFANHSKSYPGAKLRMPPAPLVLRCLTKEGNTVNPEASLGSSANPYQFFLGWFNQVYNKDTDEVGIVGEGSGTVGGDVHVTVLATDGTPFCKAWMQYAWPSSIRVNDLDRDSDGDPIDFTVTLQCNEIEFSF